MPRSVVDFFDEASKLDEHDRATLAGLLLKSIEHESDPGVEEAWKREITRRIERLDSGSVSLVSWEEVKAKLFACSERRILIVRFHAAAEAELLEARAWYAERSEIAARAFATAVARAVREICNALERWKRYVGSYCRGYCNRNAPRSQSGPPGVGGNSACHRCCLAATAKPGWRRPNIGPAGRVLHRATRLRRRAGAHLARRGMAIRGISRIPCEGCGVHVKDTRAIGAAIRRCG